MSLGSRGSQLDFGNDCTNFAEFYKSKELKGRNAMKRSKLLPILLLMLTSLALAQSAPSSQQSPSGAQAGTPPAPGVRAGQRAQRHEQMQAMCKEHIEAMKADAQKMHSAFDKMKANVASISNADEKVRWQANIDLWQTMVDHHDQMLKHMEDAQAKGMGCGMMMGGMGMGGGMSPMKPAPTGPAETKPQ
jgi:hypothetical protein